MTRELTLEEANNFGAELDALRGEQLAKLGDRDAKHIRGVIKVQKSLALTGRGLLWFGFMPPIFVVTWPLGVLCLGAAKILENMEIGHNVMHGQYDWMNDESLNSQVYDWDTVSDSDGWRYTHNYEHHTYTNIIGKDRDVGYGVLRVSADQPWEPQHLANPISNVLLAAGFDMGVGLHELELDRLVKGEKPWRESVASGRKLARKAMRLWGKDYLIFPLLSGPNFAGVLAGNFAANMIRNFWTNMIIMCGHFPGDTKTYEYDESVLENETRGQWYVRQMNGSANIEGGRVFHIMSGHLSHQIEHHLFPDIPAFRYPEMAPKVQEICHRYGQQYVSGSFLRQYGSVLGKIFKYALPSKGQRLAVA
ncbi:MAG: fatty acid desaturase family protein [Spongiibacteraceae bacterium]